MFRKRVKCRGGTVPPALPTAMTMISHFHSRPFYVYAIDNPITNTKRFYM